VTDVVLTHNHLDHTGGLVTLRQELSRKNPRALSRAHVGKGIAVGSTFTLGKGIDPLLLAR
jgi:7,8-dihydropterin-6-yl-methyl-4-(beta-D-ribofuranosyl)aminobenzene 5'-phosphate synthase